MEYNKLLESHLKYGTTEEKIIKRKGYEQILENVVMAPWWSHKMFENFNFKIEQVSEKVFNIYGENFCFSFIELQLIGAPVILDETLSLGATKCKNLLFIGSVGSLDNNIKIGDIVIPEYSICGDGASRYLNDDMSDEFGKKQYPTLDFTNKLIEIVANISEVKYHYVPNYSIDTIFAQFAHIDSIINLGVKTIEMETSALFKCNSCLNINMAALFCVSDNTILNKSLYSGRTEQEKEYRNRVRNEIIPKIIIELFKN